MVYEAPKKVPSHTRSRQKRMGANVGLCQLLVSLCRLRVGLCQLMSAYVGSGYKTNANISSKFCLTWWEFWSKMAYTNIKVPIFLNIIWMWVSRCSCVIILYWPGLLSISHQLSNYDNKKPSPTNVLGGTNMDDPWESQMILDNPGWAIQDNLGPSRTILAIQDHLGRSRMIYDDLSP